MYPKWDEKTFEEKALDEEAQIRYSRDKDRRQTFHAFFRMVHAILAVQYLCFAGSAALFYFKHSAIVAIYNEGLRLILWLATVAFVILLVCYHKAAERYPTNYIIFVASTVLLCFNGGFWTVTDFFGGGSIGLQYFLGSAIMAACFAIFACQQKYTYTDWVGVAYVVACTAAILVLHTMLFVNSLLNNLCLGIVMGFMAAYFVRPLRLIVEDGLVTPKREDCIYAAGLMSSFLMAFGCA